VRLATRLYVLLLAVVGAGRLLELRISRRHQAALARYGAAPVPEPAFPWLVALHTGVLAGSALEAILLRRRQRRALAAAAAAAALMAGALRWWTMATLGQHWNVHIVDSLHLGVVSHGPYRWLRHPNYLALIVELEALPLMHWSWLTALIGGAAHLLLLRRRIAAEEAVLMRDPAYRAAMGAKPRLLPRIGRS
jgi:methyltransferase